MKTSHSISFSTFVKNTMVVAGCANASAMHCEPPITNADSTGGVIVDAVTFTSASSRLSASTTPSGYRPLLLTHSVHIFTHVVHRHATAGELHEREAGSRAHANRFRD